MDNSLDRNQLWSPSLSRPYHQLQGHADFLLTAQHPPSSSTVTRRNQPGAPQASQIHLEEHQPSYPRPHIPFPQHHRYLPETTQLHTQHPQFQQRQSYGVPRLPTDPRDNTPGPSHTSAEDDADDYPNGHGMDRDNGLQDSHEREQHRIGGEQPSMDEEPLYVNAKQYNRILKRRVARARLEELHRLSKQRKPYLHESRHKHAMRRPRGPGGRFLTAEEIAAQQKAAAEAADSLSYQNPNPSAEERKALKASASESAAALAAVAGSTSMSVDQNSQTNLTPSNDSTGNSNETNTSANMDTNVDFQNGPGTSATPVQESFPQQGQPTGVPFMDMNTGSGSGSTTLQ
ncbi:hypothetical protein M422DRAFT_27935 [Sphaerobolus stellatus SS14]|nr:hypothetical protein M422DRAFT_27935 [Sphaerobolus stellatus SS14]